MIVNFGERRCPICGDFGKEVEKDTFSCGKCSIKFDKFHISEPNPKKSMEYKYWT